MLSILAARESILGALGPPDDVEKANLANAQDRRIALSIASREHCRLTEARGD
jgi:hypothetical protein